MAELTYAQNGEDIILARFFSDVPHGFFVEAGAYDGVTYSNTYLLEKRGWDGMCIEPNPRSYERCCMNRTATCLQAALVEYKSQRTTTLLVPEMEILATLSTEHDAEIGIIHKNVNAEFNGYKRISVPALTLDSILRRFNAVDIDLLSVDTEWTNGEVMRGANLQQHRPRVVVVEGGRGVREAMASYHLCHVNVDNLFYVRDVADIPRMVDAAKERVA